MKNYTNLSSSKDEIKLVTNRAIGKLLESLNGNISPAVEREIKHHIRWLENNIRDIFDKNIRGNQHGTTQNN